MSAIKPLTAQVIYCTITYKRDADMSTTSITFRADADIKKRFESIAADMGLPVTGLLNAFMKATVREGKLPFDLVSDEYAHKRMIRAKLEEAQAQASDPATQWLTHDDVFDKFRKKYGYEKV